MSFPKRRSSTVGEASERPTVEVRRSQCQYDVFLNFRGADTRYSFVDSLYESLKDAGINTFMDEERLHKGETIGPELLSAIQQSSISIPIFSEGYAESKWCFLELEEMLKCRARGQRILPVFCYVEPRNVRNQDGSYKKGFKKLSKNFNNETIKAWKEALKEVGAIKGWEVNNTANGSQGKIVKSIVNHVLRELKKGYLNVTNNLVGAKQHERAILKLLNADSDSSTDIVGIHGIGGIGKTTLSKVIYNRLRNRFEQYSFLESIRDNKLKSLQKQLISDVLKQDVGISNLDEGTRMIQKGFCTKKVLILLDDVDDPKQLKNLAGCHTWFGIGSKIIITTRDKKILRTSEAKPYELQELDGKQSLQLFSKHAFRAKEPPNNYLALSKQFVSLVGGLPLAVEVLGSSLHGENEKVWKSRLTNLERGPLREVADKLRITYDILTSDEQQMFLDIACQFIGMDIREAIHFWDSLNYLATESVDALLDKSLIKIGDAFKLKMHDQLRDLGRDIVREESTKEDNMPSRVWDCDKARHIIAEKNGNDNIKSLNLGARYLGPRLRSYPPSPLDDEFESPLMSICDEQLTKLTKLKFLQAGYAKFDGDFHQLLPDLRWLIWTAGRGCQGDPEIDAPRNFNLKSLVILDLSYSSITESWNGWSQIKGKNLRVLNLTGCPLTRTPNLSLYTNLQRLILSECRMLVEIDKSIGKLKNLTSFDLSGCLALEMLPPELGSLNALEELLIRGTRAEKLPHLEVMNKLEILHVGNLNLKDVSSIFHLTSLKDLAIEFSNITQLPDSIGSLVNLESLSLRLCKHLRELPETIENLKSLRELFLNFSGIVELPQAIARLSPLRTLDLTSCHNLQSVLALPINLTDFRLDWNTHWKSDLPTSINLQELDFTEEAKSSQTVSLAELFSLIFSEREELTFEHPHRTTSLVEFSSFTQLKKLAVVKCYQLRRISELPSSLSYLQIDECPSLEEVPNLSDLSALQELLINRCYRLREIRGVEGLKLLQRLVVSYCTELRKLHGIEKLESLELLDTTQCLVLEIPDIASKEKLKGRAEVEISSFEELQKFDSNSSLQYFKTVESLIISCLDIVFLPKNFTALKCLGKLKLSDLYSLKALPALPESLVSLQVLRCYDLMDWPRMSNLKNLSKLAISRTMLREIQGLGELKSLTYLDIRMCQNLTTLAGLEELVCLERLKLDCCISLRVLPNLSNLKKLQIVRATNCVGLDGIEGLEGLNLKEFTFYNDGSTDFDDFDGWASNKPTDVFLSLCGEAAPESFVDLLLKDLKLRGVNAFRDEERFRTRESIRPEVRNAIWQSSICVPIFSKGCAYSEQWLRELEEIVECQKATGLRKMRAALYDVSFTDFRNQTGPYEEAFLQHSKDFNVETVKAWKEALRKATSVSFGQPRGNDPQSSDWFERAFRESIVNQVVDSLEDQKDIIAGLDRGTWPHGFPSAWECRFSGKFILGLDTRILMGVEFPCSRRGIQCWNSYCQLKF